MEIEKEKISNLVNKLSERVEDLSNSPEERDKLIRTIVETIETDLSDDEKVTLYKYVFEELSFKRMVEQPDFMIKQSNVRLRGIFFSGMLVLILIIIAGVLFSNSPLITNFHNYILQIFELASLK